MLHISLSVINLSIYCNNSFLNINLQQKKLNIQVFLSVSLLTGLSTGSQLVPLPVGRVISKGSTLF